MFTQVECCAVRGWRSISTAFWRSRGADGGRWQRLTALQTLDLEGCSGLRALPVEIGALTGLQMLSLARCWGLGTLPVEIGGLTGLQTLNLGRCSGLTSLPGEIGALQVLNRWTSCPGCNLPLTVKPTQVCCRVPSSASHMYVCVEIHICIFYMCNMCVHTCIVCAYKHIMDVLYVYLYFIGTLSISICHSYMYISIHPSEYAHLYHM